MRKFFSRNHEKSVSFVRISRMLLSSILFDHSIQDLIILYLIVPFLKCLEDKKN